MSSAPSPRRPGAVQGRLLRLQYRYDRLTERQRLLSGLVAILFLATTWLYVLGLGSTVLVSRAEALGAPVAVTGTPERVVVLIEPTPGEPEPSLPQPNPTATPAVEAAGDLIQAPDVPEVAIIPPPPRAIATPLSPLKPRVVAATPAPARAAVSPAPALPTRAVTVGPTTPTPPVRTAAPLIPTPANGGPTRTPIPPTRGLPVPPATPAATSVPARPPVVNTPPLPTLPPRQPATPNPRFR